MAISDQAWACGLYDRVERTEREDLAVYSDRLRLSGGHLVQSTDLTICSSRALLHSVIHLTAPADKPLIIHR